MARLDFLSCSATAGMTVQLLYMLHSCASFGGLQAASHPRVPTSLHNFEHFFTLSHTLPLHDSHLNTGLLLLNYKKIWHGIKPTRWLIKFNLTDSLNGCTSSKFKMTIRFLKWMHIVQVQEDDKINIDQEYFNKKFSKSPDGRRELFNKNSLSSNMDKENTSIRILQVPRWTKRTLQ